MSDAKQLLEVAANYVDVNLGASEAMRAEVKALVDDAVATSKLIAVRRTRSIEGVEVVVELRKVSAP